MAKTRPLVSKKNLRTARKVLKALGQPTPASSRTPAPRRARDTHVPPDPPGAPLEPWGPPTGRIDVVGESHRQDAFLALFGRRPTGGSSFEASTQAALVADPGNPHDNQAVAVRVNGHHIGNLGCDDATRWHQPTAYFAQMGRHLVVPARVWFGPLGDGTLTGSVTLRVPPTSQILPSNYLPTVPHVVLPLGSTIQVTKEELHMDVLSTWATGEDVAVSTTLHEVQEARARSTVDVVEVRLDGRRVGVLSPQQSTTMLPLVRHVAARRLVPVARATVKGNTLKADVVLHVAKTQDIDPTWLQSLG